MQRKARDTESFHMVSSTLQDRAGLFWKMVWGAFKLAVKIFHHSEQMWQSMPQYAGACQDIPPSKTDILILPFSSSSLHHLCKVSKKWGAETEAIYLWLHSCLL